MKNRHGASAGVIAVVMCGALSVWAAPAPADQAGPSGAGSEAQFVEGPLDRTAKPLRISGWPSLRLSTSSRRTVQVSPASGAKTVTLLRAPATAPTEWSTLGRWRVPRSGRVTVRWKNLPRGTWLLRVRAVPRSSRFWPATTRVAQVSVGRAAPTLGPPTTPPAGSQEPTSPAGTPPPARPTATPSSTRTVDATATATSTATATATSTATSTATTTATSTATVTPTPTATPIEEYPTSNLGSPTQFAFTSSVRWAPCAIPITWHMDLGPLLTQYGGSASTEEGLMVAALRSITRHTGYQFRRVANPGEAAITVTGVEHLTGSVIGQGGWSAIGTEVTAGTVVVDIAQMSAASPAVRAQVYAHELGHVFVLDHTDGYQQTMYPSVTQSNLAWGAGDVAGLNSLPDYTVC